MTITEFRARLLAEVLDQAQALAIENGSSLARTHDERTAYAGMVVGMQRAAGIIDEFNREDDDDGRS
jgi:hypothetical protein